MIRNPRWPVSTSFSVERRVVREGGRQPLQSAELIIGCFPVPSVLATKGLRSRES